MAVSRLVLLLLLVVLVAHISDACFFQQKKRRKKSLLGKALGEMMEENLELAGLKIRFYSQYSTDHKWGFQASIDSVHW
jgi:hypothetical protein